MVVNSKIDKNHETLGYFPKIAQQTRKNVRQSANKNRNINKINVIFAYQSIHFRFSSFSLSVEIPQLGLEKFFSSSSSSSAVIRSSSMCFIAFFSSNIWGVRVQNGRVVTRLESNAFIDQYASQTHTHIQTDTFDDDAFHANCAQVYKNQVKIALL